MCMKMACKYMHVVKHLYVDMKIMVKVESSTDPHLYKCIEFLCIVQEKAVCLAYFIQNISLSRGLAAKS